MHKRLGDSSVLLYRMPNSHFDSKEILSRSDLMTNVTRYFNEGPRDNRPGTRLDRVILERVDSPATKGGKLQGADDNRENVKSNFCRNLLRDYGVRFLVLSSLTSHCLKGFCRAQLQISSRYLFQSTNISGPRLDAFVSMIDIPWSMKPLVSLLSDSFPLWGYKKIPYMTMSLALGLTGICLVVVFGDHSDIIRIEMCIVGMFLANFAYTTTDILSEGLFARRMAVCPHSAPDFSVFLSIGQQVAFVVSCIISGFTLEYAGGLIDLSGAQWNILFCVIPTAATLYPVLRNYGGEPHISKDDAKRQRVKMWTGQKPIVCSSILCGLASLIFASCATVLSPYGGFSLCLTLIFVLNFVIWALFNPCVSKLLVFLTIMSLTNMSLSGPAHYFYTDTPAQFPRGPHFEPWFFVTVCGLVGAAVTIVALLVYTSFFKAAKYKAVFLTLCTLNALLSVPNSLLFSRLNVDWGISDYWFVASDTALQTAIAGLLSVPTFLLLSRVCPDQLESSMFAILAATTNFAQTANGLISAFICESLAITPDGSPDETEKFANMWIANLILAGLKLVPLIFLWLLPDNRMTDSMEFLRTDMLCDSPWRRFTFNRNAKTSDV